MELRAFERQYLQARVLVRPREENAGETQKSVLVDARRARAHTRMCKLTKRSFEVAKKTNQTQKKKCAGTDYFLVHRPTYRTNVPGERMPCVCETKASPLQRPRSVEGVPLKELHAGSEELPSALLNSSTVTSSKGVQAARASTAAASLFLCEGLMYKHSNYRATSCGFSPFLSA